MKTLINQIPILLLFIFIPLISCGQTIDGKKERLNFKIENAVVFYKGSPFSGKIVCYHENGKLKSESSFKNGIPHGKSVSFFKNELVMGIINYHDGELNGGLEWYFDNGQISKRYTILNGKYEGNYESFYNNGQKKEFGLYKNDSKTGEWKMYFNNGKLQFIENYIDDRKTGEWKGYFNNGKLQFIENYKDDQYEGVFEYYNIQGVLEKKYICSNGKIIEKIIELNKNHGPNIRYGIELVDEDYDAEGDDFFGETQSLDILPKFPILLPFNIYSCIKEFE
jgi:antitoxin component YwqK of YwqJK toxin-antitoxin module